MKFWEEFYINNKTTWGFEPVESAIICKDFFTENNINNIISDFENYNIINISKIEEPIKHMKDQKSLNCFNVICKKI